MKKINHFSHFVLVSVFVVVFASCGKDEPQTPSRPSVLNGNIESPGWVVDSIYDYSASMTAVVVVDLLQSFPEADGYWSLDNADMLAAFCGDECLGVARPDEGIFFLFIHAPANYATGDNDDLFVTLHYYSAKLKNIYVSDISFPFLNGDRIGSVLSPHCPSFQYKPN